MEEFPVSWGLQGNRSSRSTMFIQAKFQKSEFGNTRAARFHPKIRFLTIGNVPRWVFIFDHTSWEDPLILSKPLETESWDFLPVG